MVLSRKKLEKSSARSGSAYGLRIVLTSNVDDFIKKNVREQFCEIRQWEESRQDELIV